jgi:glycosyltransferase involved in cell wall biosynthesis
VARGEKKSFRVSTTVVSPSRYEAEIAERFYGISSQVIRHGIDTESFTPANPVSVRSVPVALFVGNPILRKGFDTVLRVARRLRCQIRVFVLPGFRRRRWVSRLDDVTVLPTVRDDQLPGVYQNADLLLFPSRLESFGYVAAEAMASGLPIVAGKGHALDELVVDHRGGFLVDPEDVEEVAGRTLELARDPNLRLRMGEFNRARALSQLSESMMLDSYERLLKDVC